MSRPQFIGEFAEQPSQLEKSDKQTPPPHLPPLVPRTIARGRRRPATIPYGRRRRRRPDPLCRRPDLLCRRPDLRRRPKLLSRVSSISRCCFSSSSGDCFSLSSGCCFSSSSRCCLSSSSRRWSSAVSRASPVPELLLLLLLCTLLLLLEENGGGRLLGCRT